jgi:uncharacterized membrane protein YvlD (DUF360 family)
MLMVTGWLSESWNLGFTVSGFWAAFFGGLVIGLVSTLLSLALRPKPVKTDHGFADQTIGRR